MEIKKQRKLTHNKECKIETLLNEKKSKSYIAKN